MHRENRLTDTAPAVLESIRPSEISRSRSIFKVNANTHISIFILKILNVV